MGRANPDPACFLPAFEIELPTRYPAVVPAGQGAGFRLRPEIGAGGRSVCAWRNHGFPARLGRPANAVAPLHQSDQGGGDASDFRSLRMW